MANSSGKSLGILDCLVDEALPVSRDNKMCSKLRQERLRVFQRDSSWRALSHLLAQRQKWWHRPAKGRRRIMKLRGLWPVAHPRLRLFVLCCADLVVAHARPGRIFVKIGSTRNRELDGNLERNTAHMRVAGGVSSGNGTANNSSQHANLRVLSCAGVRCDTDGKLDALNMGHSKSDSFVVAARSSRNKYTFARFFLGIRYSINNIQQSLLYECA